MWLCSLSKKETNFVLRYVISWCNLCFWLSLCLFKISILLILYTMYIFWHPLFGDLWFCSMTTISRYCYYSCSFSVSIVIGFLSCVSNHKNVVITVERLWFGCVVFCFGISHLLGRNDNFSDTALSEQFRLFVCSLWPPIRVIFPLNCLIPLVSNIGVYTLGRVSIFHWVYCFEMFVAKLILRWRYLLFSFTFEHDWWTYSSHKCLFVVLYWIY